MHDPGELALRGSTAALSGELWGRLLPYVEGSPRLMWFQRELVLRGPQTVRGEALIRAWGVNANVVQLGFDRDGFPTLKRQLMWTRLLYVNVLIGRGLLISEVAGMLRYSHASYLSGHVRRVAHMTARAWGALAPPAALLRYTMRYILPYRSRWDDPRRLLWLDRIMRAQGRAAA